MATSTSAILHVWKKSFKMLKHLRKTEFCPFIIKSLKVNMLQENRSREFKEQTIHTGV